MSGFFFPQIHSQIPFHGLFMLRFARCLPLVSFPGYLVCFLLLSLGGTGEKLNERMEEREEYSHLSSLCQWLHFLCGSGFFQVALLLFQLLPGDPASCTPVSPQPKHGHGFLLLPVKQVASFLFWSLSYSIMCVTIYLH